MHLPGVIVGRCPEGFKSSPHFATGMHPLISGILAA